jgi:hypothetical protein
MIGPTGPRRFTFLDMLRFTFLDRQFISNQRVRYSNNSVVTNDGTEDECDLEE